MPQPEQKERKVTPAKRVQSILPWLGGGALGVAGLSEVARRGAFTPELLKDMSSFSQKLDNDQIFKPYAHLPEGEQNVQAMVDYAVQGNRLLNNRMWGVVSPTSIIKGLRSLPFLPDDWKWHSDAQQHYDTFERSPAGGFVRVLGELSHGGWGAKDPTYTQERGDLIRKAIRDATNATAGVNYADTSGGTPSWNFPTVGFPEQLSRDKQMGMMRNMAPALKEHITKQPDGASLWDAFSKYLQDGRRTVYNNYSRITDNLQNVNSGWGAVNTALAGVGAAGLGGYGIWRYLENKHKQDAKKRQKQSSMKQIHIANYLIKCSSDPAHMTKQANPALRRVLAMLEMPSKAPAVLKQLQAFNRSPRSLHFPETFPVRSHSPGGLYSMQLKHGPANLDATFSSAGTNPFKMVKQLAAEAIGGTSKSTMLRNWAAPITNRSNLIESLMYSKFPGYFSKGSLQLPWQKMPAFAWDAATHAMNAIRPVLGRRLQGIDSINAEWIPEVANKLRAYPGLERWIPTKRASFIEDLKAMATQPNEEQFSKLLQDKIRSNAMTTLAITGGAPVLGALGGVGIQALRRSDTDKPKDRPSLLNGALLGGVLGLGGGMVGGAAHLIDNYRQTWNDTPLGKRGPIDLPRFWSSVLGGNKPTPMAW